MDMQVILGDFVGQQHGVFAAFGAALVVRALKNAAVDHEMGDMDILRLQFAVRTASGSRSWIGPRARFEAL